ncbi:hypothetical protein [Falsiphaeobacter marinintestinus]|uniref:hypothetical protein n=1 Tax=Falsiphaeobacter marinintestinus TaxID=1492905 RepID=UPI0011B4E007|nr:hypothetical protein [Phaeobacter marinintestinus]
MAIQTSDVIALVALLVSGLSFWQARSGQRSQERLTDREVQLVRHQLSQFERDERASKEANVSAKLFKVDKNVWKLRVFNRGPAEARNVNVSPITSEGSMFPESSISQKLPMQVMEKDSSVDINAFPHFGSALKETIQISWDDASSANRTKDIEVTV